MRLPFINTELWLSFLQKKDNIFNFVDCNNVEVDLEEPNSDPLDDPLEPEVQEIKIEDVKIEFEGDVSWNECFKDVLNTLWETIQMHILEDIIFYFM